MAGPVRKVSTPRKAPFSSQPRSSVKKNTSLLNFFQKADGPPKATSRQSRITQFTTKSENPNESSISPRPRFLRRDDSSSNNTGGGLFLEDKRGVKPAEIKSTGNPERERSQTPDDDFWGDGLESTDARDGERYNGIESNGSMVKRRKLESPVDGPDATQEKKTALKHQKLSGPFIDESDSEDELNPFNGCGDSLGLETVAAEVKDETSPPDDRLDKEEVSAADTPPPVRDITTYTEYDEVTNFDELEENQFQEEECFLDTNSDAEEEQDAAGLCFGNPDDFPALIKDDSDFLEEEATCPICQVSLGGLNDTDILVHVNNCLDGKPSTIALNRKAENPGPGLTRVERAAIAKPAQRDPFHSTAAGAASAFSKIMAGNAEDTAWASAAASDVATRGKQAYQRTCPFYKIISGFSVSVDAFRYGAVEGCNAYFLSHFHSDHYGGLTGSWRHGPIYCSKPTGNLVRQQLKVNPKWVVDLEFEKETEIPNTGGVRVTMIEANHCPGSSLFLFEKPIGSSTSKRVQRVLHCGDFRASPLHVQHALLRPDAVNPVTGQHYQQRIDVCYLDTTYLSPKYAFPSQADVITACAELCVRFNSGQDSDLGAIGNANSKSMNPLSRFLSSETQSNQSLVPVAKSQGRLLVVIGTYSIGKERICLGIARALKSKIYATPAKQRICACLADPELSSLLTDNPLDAQVHMQTLFEIRAETLSDYLDSMKPHFSRVVGFRPTGWTYRPPAGRTLENPPVSTVLNSTHWKTPFSVQDLTPQRGSTRESACFGVPYSEHSSFRELTMFCCALRIGRIIPTVNVGSQKSRERMKFWFERWEAEKRKSGLYRVSGSEW